MDSLLGKQSKSGVQTTEEKRVIEKNNKFTLKGLKWLSMMQLCLNYSYISK